MSVEPSPCPRCHKEATRRLEQTQLVIPPAWWPQGQPYDAPEQTVELVWCTHCDFEEKKFLPT